MQPYGLMLHHFKGGIHPDGQGAITADEFADMIEFMGPKNFIGPYEWMERAAAGKLEPRHRCITLDDALLCQYDIAAPVMSSYDLTGFWFVYSSVFEGNIEPLEIYRHFRSVRYPDIDDFYNAFFAHVIESPHKDSFQRMIASFDPKQYLRGFHFYTDNDRKFRFVRDRVLRPAQYFEIMDSMIRNDDDFSVEEAAKSLWMDNKHLNRLDSQGHVIGLHSYSHPTMMAALTREEQEKQFARNFEHLFSLMGKAPIAMSHPCNSYNSDTLLVLEEMGIEIGFRANLEPPNNTRFEYPRDDHAHVLKQMGVR